MKSSEKFFERIKNGKHICVGLDSALEKIPQHLLSFPDPIFEFNKKIIDATYSDAVAYKINLAFYESRGTEGIESLLKTLDFIDDEVPVIGDAKRGDIGNTAKMYAKELFEFYNFDASTINPLMGFDSAQPFLEYSDKINFVLALTSNSGSGDFEKLELKNGKLLFQQIIETTKEWGKNVGYVFGATNLNELVSNIDLMGDSFVLLPGVGAQGGSLEGTTKLFVSKNKSNFIINISRGLIYFDTTKQFAEKTRSEIVRLNRIVSDLLI